MTIETKIFVVLHNSLHWIYASTITSTSMVRFVKLNIFICVMKSL